MNGFFITGTDTDVGKTVVAAWAVRSAKAAYWKPIQTGTADTHDRLTIARLAPDAPILPSSVELSEPLSPHAAAAAEGRRIALDDIVAPKMDGRIIVEGAGGVLVPINEREMMIDLMARLGLPVVVVARSGLGTINHTLLTLQALRSRNLTVAGVVLNGAKNLANARAIAHYGQTMILGCLPPMAPVSLDDLPPLDLPWTI